MPPHAGETGPCSRALTAAEAGEEEEKQDCSFLGQIQNCTASLEEIAGFLKTRHAITILLGLYPPKWKAYIHTETYVRISVAAVFVIAKTWKQLRLCFSR